MKTIAKLLPVIALVLLFSQCATPKKKHIPAKYSIEQFYKNKKIYGGTFSEDETKLLVSSNVSGIFNVFEINIADKAEKQITNSEVESFFAIDYVPGTGEILYSADKGGNEISHIYLIDKDGNTQDLTPGEEAKAWFGGWSEDKTHLYFGSNKRDPKFFDLYKMEIGTWEPIMIYENTQGYSISDFSYDENYIALTQSITTSENKLFIFDKAKDELVEVSNPENPGNYNASGFSKDNSTLYYITNAVGEFSYLVEYNIETKEHKDVYKTNWDVAYSYASENEKFRIIAINADGRNQLVVKEIATDKEVIFPEIPDGDILAVSVSDSEKLMRLTVGTSKAPANIYVYNFETQALDKITNSLNPEINPDDLVSAEVVRFKSFDGLEIPAIYYKPHIASTDNKVPAMVWVHGGPGGQSRTGYFALIQYMVNNGYAILAVNNRGSSGYGKSFYKMDDQNHGDKDLKDCIYGKKYLQTLDYIDAEKIGIIGGSYGGYMTMAAMAFTPDEFNVGVNIFGVTNWLRTLNSIPPYWESFRKALYAEMGDPTTDDSVRLYNISPLFHANQIKNPVMVLQGANDPRVLQVESDEIVEAMKENNIPVEYVVFPDEGHGFRKKENEIKGYAAIVDFLDKYLKGIEETDTQEEE